MSRFPQPYLIEWEVGFLCMLHCVSMGLRKKPEKTFITECMYTTSGTDYNLEGESVCELSFRRGKKNPVFPKIIFGFVLIAYLDYCNAIV